HLESRQSFQFIARGQRLSEVQKAVSVLLSAHGSFFQSMTTIVFTPYGVNFPYKYNHSPQISVINRQGTSF
ncbi:MAG TPA: hypothetical protein PLQ53_09125, partial [Saprospiraceae bacterium]|nr:hypothetical protein [Saprospiraceae bacterium]